MLDPVCPVAGADGLDFVRAHSATENTNRLLRPAIAYE